MKPMTKDARGFVKGVMQYLRHEGKGAASLPKVQALFHKVSTAAVREKLVVIESAVELTASEKNTLITILSKRFDQTVEPRYEVKPELLAGMRIQKGDWVYDSSIAAHLTQLQKALTVV